MVFGEAELFAECGYRARSVGRIYGASAGCFTVDFDFEVSVNRWNQCL